MASSHFHSTLPLVDDPDSTSAVSSALDTTGLMTLSSGEGAKVTNRDNASDAADRARGAQARRHEQRRLAGDNRPSYARHEEKKVKKSPVAIVALIVAALVVAGVLIFVFSRCAGSVAENPATLSLVTSKTQVAPGETLSYGGESYELREKDGTWKLVSLSDEESALMVLDGKPVALVLYEGNLFVPENLSDGTWEIMWYPADSGAAYEPAPGGNGTGSVSKAEIDGSNLVLTLDSGETVSWPLA